MFKNLLLACAFLGTFQVLKSEYIVFKSNKKGSIDIIKDDSQKIHDKIRETLFKYQWPTCIAHFHEVKQNEIAKYTNTGNALEETYLRAKIKEIDKNFDIAFFPTSLYELFFIVNYKLYAKDYFLNYFVCDADITKLIEDPTNRLENIYKSLIDFNNINNKVGSTGNIHMRVNNDLVNYIKTFKFYKNSKNKNITNLIEKNINLILLGLLNQIDDDAKWNENTCKRILNLEYKAHKNNSGLIYRGNLSLYNFDNLELLKNPIEVTYLFKSLNIPLNYLALTKNGAIELARIITQERLNTLNNYDQLKLTNLKNILFDCFYWDSPSRSISYGNSIFAGYLCDKGACSYCYMNDKDSLGYALHINKWLYYKGIHASEIEKKSLGNLIDGELFTISPLNTLAALFGFDKWFHSRSKSYYFSKDIMHTTRVPFTLGIGPTRDLTGYFIKNGSPLQKGAELAQFISERAELIKVPERQGGFDFTPEIANSYFVSQKNIAESFRTISLLEPYLKQQLGVC